MLEPSFCRGIFYESVCIWSWRIIVSVAIIIIFFKLISSKKKYI